MAGHWKIARKVNHRSLYRYLECVMGIAQELNDLRDRSLAGRKSAPLAVRAIRNISTELRKLCLDGNGSLLKRCISVPDFHVLAPPESSANIASYILHCKEVEVALTFTDGSERKYVRPAYNYTTTIHPLHGVWHVRDDLFRIRNPFQKCGPKIRFGKWAEQKVLQVDHHTFTTRELLKIVADSEGAHVDESVPLAATTKHLKNRRDNRYPTVSAIKFGNLSYPQIFVLYTGLYIANRTKEALDVLPFQNDDEHIAEIRRIIGETPEGFVSDTAQMFNGTKEMLFFDNNGNLTGEYESGVTTTMQIPESSQVQRGEIVIEIVTKRLGRQ